MNASCKKNRWDKRAFDPVTTKAIRIEVQSSPDVSGGILEWKIGSPAVEDPKLGGVDTLRIGDQYSIKFDTTEVPSLRQWVVDDLMPVCKTWYPRIVATLGSDNFEPPTEFSITFRRKMRGVAYTAGKDIFCAGDWYEANKDGEGIGSIVHELVHVVQQYAAPRIAPATPAAERPRWLVEGIADQIRWFQYEPTDRRRKLDPKNAKYTDGYFASAILVDHVIAEHGSESMPRLNEALRQGRYHPGLWQQWFGKTVDELWAECQSDGSPRSK
ncbi:Plant Basic Secretory Protein [Rubripirellula tenax]|uniref:Plant Basic Secretory Protein n=1 Tax=Rubripirellula tenax TaxID=2528015 RepID=A0A5C6FGK7_9BACT|nr:basic secretory protein-like protein [Rubripirellula tenax]TWU59970.1 Plant Basic Secretory Protein [Rubripirellula tenax]